MQPDRGTRARRSTRSWTALLAPWAILLASSAAPPKDLPLGAAVEAELRPGEEHAYGVRLGAGAQVAILAGQISVDVKLDGSADVTSSGTDVLFLEASAAGTYEVRVRGAVEKAPAGRYDLRVQDVGLDAPHRAAFRKQIEAQSLVALGADRRKDAAAALASARDAWDAAGEPSFAAIDAYAVGCLARDGSDLAASKAAFADAASRFEKLGSRAGLVLARDRHAVALDDEGDFRAAVSERESVLAFEETLTPLDRINLRYGYGNDLKEVGEYERSLAELGPTVEAYARLGDVADSLRARVQIASVHVMRHDRVRALEELTRGVALSRQNESLEFEARFLQRLGVLYWDSGDADSASESWTRALELHRKVGNRIGEGAVLVQLGDVAYRKSDPDSAVRDYEAALAIFRDVGSKQGEARALSRLGTVLSDRGQYARAIEMQEQALAITRAQGNRQSEVTTLLNVGRTRIAAGDHARAREDLTKALAITRAEGSGISELQILGALARIDRDEGDLARALDTIEQALSKTEAAQRNAMVPSLQTTMSSDAQPLYALRTDVLMARHLRSPREGWDAKALESVERARARSLLGLLAESRVDIRKGVDPDLLERYRALCAKLASAKDASDVADLSSQLQVVEAAIRRTSPAYAALAQPVPATASEVRGVLDDRTVLLEYSLGEARSWLFAVTKGGIVTAPLPGADAVERAARDLYASLSTLPAGAPRAADASLSRMLLGPIAARLGAEWRGKRLAIVATGALLYVPFAALPVPDGSGLLVDGHEIVSLPSASVLRELRKEAVGRAKPSRTLALVGDPVFTSDDPRVTRTATVSEPAPVAMLRDPVSLDALSVGGAAGFPRLPFTREELRDIAAMLPPADTLQATDFRATRALVTDGALSSYRLVHIATHGLLNTAHPELSGLVLSLVDDKGREQDGFLRLQDIYNLRLSADLVVLSACRTALGRHVEGEGLVGLTRGFMYAGVPRVVASLWKVDDSATAALMTELYRGILRDKLPPAAALRAAQRKLAHDERYAAPFYWAGFTLAGDWR